MRKCELRTCELRTLLRAGTIAGAMLGLSACSEEGANGLPSVPGDGATSPVSIGSVPTASTDTTTAVVDRYGTTVIPAVGVEATDAPPALGAATLAAAPDGAIAVAPTAETALAAPPGETTAALPAAATPIDVASAAPGASEADLAHEKPVAVDASSAVAAAPEPVSAFELEPVAEPEETVAEPARVAAVEPESVAAVEPEPVTDPVAAVEPEPVIEPEPVAAVEPEPVIEPEPVASVEPEPVIEPEPVASVEPEPVTEPVASVEPEPVAEPVAAVEPEPLAEPEPAAALPLDESYRIRISWKPAATSDLGYYVYYGEDGADVDQLAKGVLIDEARDGDVMTAVLEVPEDLSTDAGARVCFTVSAWNSVGETERSPAQCVDTPAS